MRAGNAAQDRQLPHWNLSRVPQLSDHSACWSRYSVSSILRTRVPCELLIAVNEPILTALLVHSLSRFVHCPTATLSGHCLDSSPNGTLCRGQLTSQIECCLDFEGDFQTRLYPLSVSHVDVGFSFDALLTSVDIPNNHKQRISSIASSA